VSERCPLAPPYAMLPPLVAGDVVKTAGGFQVVRIYNAAGPFPTTWQQLRTYGPLRRMRFDHHPLPEANHPNRSLMYAAVNQPAACDPLPTVILETFGDARVIDRRTSSPHLSIWEPTRPLSLLDLTDSDWVARAGANAALTSGSRAVARGWSRAIWNAYPTIDGLIWASSVRPRGRSIVLYERAVGAIPDVASVDLPLSSSLLAPALRRIAVDLNFTLL
jgi:hypothetical protein